MKMDDLKKVIAKLIRENFHQSISEATYDFGKKQYTDKNMTPTEILDLAMAYVNEPITKLVGKTLGHRIYVANDLAKLTGTTQSDVKTRGKQPALVLFLLKNSLVSKEEYAKIYKDLLAKQIQVIKYLKNASPDMRNSSSAMRAAEKDGRGEFGESVNEMSKNDVHFKEIMKMYDRGGSFTKKKVAVIVCRNSKASRSDIEEELLDTTYEDIIQYQDELNIKESVNGGINDKTHKTDTDSEDNFLKQHKNSMSTPHIGYPAELDTYDFDDKRKKEGGYQSDTQDTEDKGYEPVKESVEGDRIQKLNDRIKALRDKMNSTKSSTQKNLIQQRLKNALQTLTKIKSGLGIKKINNESVNEAASVEAKEIGALTGVRGDAVQKFIDDNNIHARKLLAYLKIKGPHTLSNRMDISTAIVGKANNKYAQGIIKAFSESKINEAKVGNPFGLAAKVLKSLGFTGGYVNWVEGICFEKEIKGGVLQITIVQWGQSGEQYQFDAVFFPEITKSTLFGLIKKKVIDYRNGKWVSKDKASEIVDLGTGMFELSDDDYEKEIKTRVKNAIGKIHESIKLTSLVNEAKYEVYHNSYTSAIQAAKEYAEKQGYTINDDDSFTKIGLGPKKPSEGKTNRFSIELSKDGKVQRKMLQIQVYGMRTKYELNCYIG